MIIVGLTGGIGSGKTTVAKMFSELGIAIYIADTEAKRLMDTSKVIKRKLIALFGSDAYNANGLRKDKYRTDGFFSKYNANHASTIVGRYFDEDTQNCTYIIRNSWGTNYNYALKGKQKDGYHTITEKDLSQSLSELTVFE